MAKLTDAQRRARYEAYVECAEHLRVDWTDHPIEIEQGNILADQFEKAALRWLGDE